MRPQHLPAAVLLGATLSLASTAALAHGGGAAMPAEVPTAPPGDGATAQALVRELQAKALKDEETARVTAEPIKSANRALERGHGALTAGDEAHARMLFGLALEWAEAARDFDRAATAEKAAQAAGQKAYEAQTRAERARALLEETQARRGRTAAEVARVEAEARTASQGAADAESQRLDAARRKPGPQAKPAPEPPKPKAKGTAAPKKGAK